MMSVGLILSGAYCNSELVAEFGLLPPSMLPVGNKRLLEHQVALLDSVHDQLVLVLPRTYTLSHWLRSFIENKGLILHAVDPSWSVGLAIHDALSMLSQGNPQVSVLFGDTLFERIPSISRHIVSVASTPDIYEWGQFEEHRSKSASDPSLVLTGLLQFANISEYLEILKAERFDFIGALQKLDSRVGVDLIEVEGWMDFGHIQTFYKSRCSFNTAREFNEVKINVDRVTKRGSNRAKISAEAHWYKTLPSNLRLFTPQFLGGDALSYSIEYLPLPSLSELYVYGEITEGSWQKITSACGHFLSLARNEALPPYESMASIEDLVFRKTDRRLEQIRTSDLACLVTTEFVVEGKVLPSLSELFLQLKKLIRPTSEIDISVIHGDFCFSNIFFDSRSGRIKVIDPRGGGDDGPTIYGDQRYDYAKFLHSAFGAYDHAVSKTFSVEMLGCELILHGEIDLTLEKVFKDFINDSPYDLKELVLITISLFISMLPLHSDDSERQVRLVYCAYRLYCYFGVTE